VQTLEAISSIALTAMSSVVAIVALIFTYRQNVGWKPVILATNSSMHGMGGKWRFTFRVEVEFWNRRKYPIAMRAWQASITGVDILDQDPETGTETHVRDNTISSRVNDLVHPNDHQKFVIEVECEKQSLDAMRPLFDICIWYFDPYLNKSRQAKIAHKLFYPELGWKKTSAQIAVIQAVGGPWTDEA
jgi:hypothetical protein